jgi:hypothetical protein
VVSAKNIPIRQQTLMKLGRNERLMRVGTGALVLLLVQLLDLSDQAHAGCSHLAAVQSDAEGNLYSLDEVIGAGSPLSLARDAQFPTPGRSPWPSGSCSGPLCSRSTPLPISTASPLPGRSDQPAALAVPATFVVMSQESVTFDEPIAGMVEQSLSIFHPPRV